MKYIRTKDSILEREKTDIGKQFKMSIINKNNNVVIDTLIIDYTKNELVLNIAFAEYLRTHNLDVRNYRTKLETIDNSLVLNQADTIKDLCDEFILVAPYRFRLPKTASELDKDFDEMRYFYTDKDDNIFGAIWTDKGLIYVAKVNEKRELELL